MKRRSVRIAALCILVLVSYFLGFYTHVYYVSRQFPIWLPISNEEVYAEKEGVRLSVQAVVPNARDEQGEESFTVILERDEMAVDISGRANFTVVWAPQESGPWHIVYRSHFATRLVAGTQPGPVTITYEVPGAVFARKKGCYRIGMEDGLYADLANPYA